MKELLIPIAVVLFASVLFGFIGYVIGHERGWRASKIDSGLTGLEKKLGIK
jgi:hypothetical protein